MTTRIAALAQQFGASRPCPPDIDHQAMSCARRMSDSCQPREQASDGMASGIPSWTIFTSVPQETFFRDIVVSISPGRLGSSNLSVWRMRSFGASSRNCPPKEWLWPVVKFVKDIL